MPRHAMEVPGLLFIWVKREGAISRACLPIRPANAAPWSGMPPPRAAVERTAPAVGAPMAAPTAAAKDLNDCANLGLIKWSDWHCLRGRDPSPRSQRRTTASASVQVLPPAAMPLFSDPNAGPWPERNYGPDPVVCLWHSLSGLDTAPLASRPLRRSITVLFDQTGPFGSYRSLSLRNFQEVQALLGGRGHPGSVTTGAEALARVHQLGDGVHWPESLRW